MENEYRNELEKQIKEKQTTKIICGVFIALGFLLTLTLVLAIIGIPMMIIAIIVGYICEGSQKKLNLCLAKI